jgi:hypothetical protein
MVPAPPRRRTMLVLAAALAMGIGPALAQPRHDPRAPAAETHMARCDAAAARLGEAHLRDLHVAFRQMLPFARDILSAHHVQASFSDGGRQARVELHLRHVRSLDIPEGNPRTTYLTGVDGAAILQDRRSRHPALWQVDEATVAAADRAYDIRYRDPADPASRPWLEDSDTAAALTGYEVIGLYTDRYSGFAGLALEAKDRRHPHRIYAIAGTHVFDHTDLRTWASGLTMGRGQFVSSSALRMIRDAADYAADMRGGGEVFVTGQSQGGMTSQGVGYLLQAYLDARRAPHHLVHVVSWGAVGARETLGRLIAHWREGQGRGVWHAIERHWAATDPDYATAAEVWNAIAAGWAAVPAGAEDAHLSDVAGRMRAVGYFFEIDLFSRGGTFLGTTFAFPTALILPDDCDVMVAEMVAGSQGGDFGVRLESHFLKGYRRAVGRGAIAVARPARPAKWDWVADLMPTLETIGDLWLETLWLTGDATLPPHWRGCTTHAEWFTRENRVCRAAHWPGCGPDPAATLPRWCLVREAAPGRTLPELR